MVKFVKADVIMSGDFYRQIGYPFPDRNNGGSVQGLIDGLQQMADAAGPNTKIVPGHGVVVNKTEVLAHRAMAIALRDKIAALAKQGKSADEIVAGKPTADYDAKVPQGPTTSERFVRAIVAEATARSLSVADSGCDRRPDVGRARAAFRLGRLELHGVAFVDVPEDEAAVELVLMEEVIDAVFRPDEPVLAVACDLLDRAPHGDPPVSWRRDPGSRAVCRRDRPGPALRCAPASADMRGMCRSIPVRAASGRAGTSRAAGRRPSRSVPP
jgi:hypothetical protein